jgi:hypothetical protein
MSPATSTVELRARLKNLRLERLAAADCGLTDWPQYTRDLDEEVAECVAALTLATLTEIAALRGELFGPEVG